VTTLGIHGTRDSSVLAGAGGAAAQPGAPGGEGAPQRAPGGSLARALARAALQAGARVGGASGKAPVGDAVAVRAAAVRLLAVLRCCDATSTIGAPERERAGCGGGLLSRCCRWLVLPGPREGWRTAPMCRSVLRQDEREERFGCLSMSTAYPLRYTAQAVHSSLPFSCKAKTKLSPALPA
jgi:hypothetical protein